MTDIQEVTAIPLVLALVELIKRFNLNSRLVPVISILIGFVVAYLIAPTFDIKEVIMRGLIYGLSASGLYSSQKAVRGL